VKCRCGALLGQVNAAGEPIVRTRALVLKAAGLALVCPKCKADVAVNGELAKALGVRLLLLKAHGKDHDRHLASGKVVHVTAHDTIIPPGWEKFRASKSMHEWRKPLTANDPFRSSGPGRGGQQYIKVNHIVDGGEAYVVNGAGYRTSHPDLQSAFDHAEKQVNRKISDR